MSRAAIGRVGGLEGGENSGKGRWGNSYGHCGMRESWCGVLFMGQLVLAAPPPVGCPSEKGGGGRWKVQRWRAFNSCGSNDDDGVGWVGDRIGKFSKSLNVGILPNILLVQWPMTFRLLLPDDGRKCVFQMSGCLQMEINCLETYPSEVSSFYQPAGATLWYDRWIMDRGKTLATLILSCTPNKPR